MTNKFFKRAGIAATAAALAFGAASAGAYSLTFQGVTFTTTAVDSDTLQLTMTNLLSATDDWTGINYLGAFAMKNTDDAITDGSISDWTTETFHEGGLNAGGCDGSGSGYFCFSFSPLAPLTDTMTFTMDLTGSNFDTSGIWHLKVQFFCLDDSTSSKKKDDGPKKCGSLLSQDINGSSSTSTSTSSTSSSGDVPEPGPMSLTLLGLGLLGVGFMRRAKQSA